MKYSDSQPVVLPASDAIDSLDLESEEATTRHVRTMVFGASILLVMIALAILVPLLSPFESNGQDLLNRFLEPGAVDSNGARHWMGTDSLGRDVMLRVFVGARYSLFISVASVLAMFTVGTTVGLVSGYFGGKVDGFLMRVVDLQMAFPVVLAAIALVALFGPSFWNIVLVFMVTGWPIFARTSRASTLSLKEVEFIDAARALGAGRLRIMFREVLPNLMGQLLVLMSYQLAEVILFESSLGFLGLGIQPPTPTWGGMMADGRSYLDTSWWIVFFPGIALLLTAAGANRLGNAYSKIVEPDR